MPTKRKIARKRRAAVTSTEKQSEKSNQIEAKELKHRRAKLNLFTHTYIPDRDMHRSEEYKKKTFNEIQNRRANGAEKN